MSQNGLDNKTVLNKIIELQKVKGVFTNCYYNIREISEGLENGRFKIFIEDNNLILLEENELFIQVFFWMITCNAFDYMRLYRRKFHKSLVMSIVAREEIPLKYLQGILDAGFVAYKRYFRKNAKCNRISEIVDESRIRSAKMQDVTIIMKMMKETFDVYSDHLPDEKELCEMIRNNCVLCIEEEEIQGFLIFEDKGKVSYLRCLCVSNKYRGKRIGSTLLDYYWNIHKETTRNFTLWVYEKNYPAISLYDKKGYRSDGLIDNIFLLDKNHMEHQIIHMEEEII